MSNEITYYAVGSHMHPNRKSTEFATSATRRENGHNLRFWDQVMTKCCIPCPSPELFSFVFLMLGAIACSAEGTGADSSGTPHSAPETGGAPQPNSDGVGGSGGSIDVAVPANAGATGNNAAAGTAGMATGGNAVAGMAGMATGGNVGMGTAGMATGGNAGAGTAGMATGGNPVAGMAGGQTGGASPGDDDNCGEATIEPVIEFIPGNLMVIFDRSLSMNDLFEATTRLNAAYYAILNGLQDFVCASDEPDCEEQLNVASILLPSFPGGVGACYVEDITSPQQINWMSATQFVTAWQTYWNAMPDPDPFVLVLGTPITPAFQRAAEAIDAAALPGRTAVLFITDGLGTCEQGTSADAQAATWLAEGIQTYVVSVASLGLLIPGDGSAFNDAVALAGGTDQALNPADVSSLNAALRDIMQEASAAPSCEVTLEGGELIDLDAACERGTVTVAGVDIACDQQNKTEGFWVKAPDQIELVGSACDTLQAEGQLSASFPCDVIVIE